MVRSASHSGFRRTGCRLSLGAGSGVVLPDKALSAVGACSGGGAGVGAVCGVSGPHPPVLLPASVLGAVWRRAPVWMEPVPSAPRRGGPLSAVCCPCHRPLLRCGAGHRLRRADLPRGAQLHLYHGGRRHQRGACSGRDPGAGHYGDRPGDPLRPEGKPLRPGGRRRRRTVHRSAAGGTRGYSIHLVRISGRRALPVFRRGRPRPAVRPARA